MVEVEEVEVVRTTRTVEGEEETECGRDLTGGEQSRRTGSPASRERRGEGQVELGTATPQHRTGVLVLVLGCRSDSRGPRRALRTI